MRTEQIGLRQQLEARGRFHQGDFEGSFQYLSVPGDALPKRQVVGTCWIAKRIETPQDQQGKRKYDDQPAAPDAYFPPEDSLSRRSIRPCVLGLASDLRGGQQRQGGNDQDGRMLGGKR